MKEVIYTIFDQCKSKNRYGGENKKSKLWDSDVICVFAGKIQEPTSALLFDPGSSTASAWRFTNFDAVKRKNNDQVFEFSGATIIVRT